MSFTSILNVMEKSSLNMIDQKRSQSSYRKCTRLLSEERSKYWKQPWWIPKGEVEALHMGKWKKEFWWTTFGSEGTCRALVGDAVGMDWGEYHLSGNRKPIQGFWSEKCPEVKAEFSKYFNYCDIYQLEYREMVSKR